MRLPGRIFFWGGERGKMRKVAVLVDYENMILASVPAGQVIDFDSLMRSIRDEIGVVKVAMAFLPLGAFLSDQTIRNLDEVGIDCVACPRYDVAGTGKEKDKVDSRMIALAKKLFDEHSDVTDIAIISNDGDFTPLVTFFQHRGKTVTLFGLGEISGALKRVVDIVRIAPVKNS
ncbi:MAG: hypothetical protein COZ49_00365 [Candidatus Yonathbacteria bacterium CG_4_10_14_3_um_filter_47_65]|uniref:NYN domain-containing protein n=1 Tax=Candidatus Nomurabacteria bacterium CG1_02_47_685 TaxID=1805282 RepID=A0A1J4V668_9BACT|nr:MAG: hypothetical protein AUJ44_01975 [Candidatus Nomurabacteria bacterium CG1_02_47_685]PIQ31837.1 MAG: hypothetical protein COW61_03045 [Candidatus Yonathbacteria bacterium CG17_big_fil_post_rev_8_21_14_2_50_46_19]PIX56782.1 MAG: hypothetical protein COZ49_00365 [Candidatus Yonathbacteria bacterium CG_4_10_14_3_um_filter_47_65]PIY57616.1 MAG: hypothetical protein COY99_02360 [Candidatus Yonathbacteria bacterium CG_4_10_14_0_8_um_filter_47_645]